MSKDKLFFTVDDITDDEDVRDLIDVLGGQNLDDVMSLLARVVWVSNKLTWERLIDLYQAQNSD